MDAWTREMTTVKLAVMAVSPFTWNTTFPPAMLSIARAITAHFLAPCGDEEVELFRASWLELKRLELERLVLKHVGNRINRDNVFRELLSLNYNPYCGVAMAYGKNCRGCVVVKEGEAEIPPVFGGENFQACVLGRPSRLTFIANLFPSFIVFDEKQRVEHLIELVDKQLSDGFAARRMKKVSEWMSKMKGGPEDGEQDV